MYDPATPLLVNKQFPIPYKMCLMHSRIADCNFCQHLSGWHHIITCASGSWLRKMQSDWYMFYLIGSVPGLCLMAGGNLTYWCLIPYKIHHFRCKWWSMWTYFICHQLCWKQNVVGRKQTPKEYKCSWSKFCLKSECIFRINFYSVHTGPINNFNRKHSF